MKITRHEEFEAAHILEGYNGPCGRLHGHSYKIEVTVEGEQKENNFGMVMDFSELKKIIKEIVPDHMFIYDSRVDNGVQKDIVDVLKKYNIKCVGYPFCPTAENMCNYFAELFNKRLVEYDCKVSRLKLWETTNSFAEYEVK